MKKFLLLGVVGAVLAIASPAHATTNVLRVEPGQAACVEMPDGPYPLSVEVTTRHRSATLTLDDGPTSPVSRTTTLGRLRVTLAFAEPGDAPQLCAQLDASAQHGRRIVVTL